MQTQDKSVNSWPLYHNGKVKEIVQASWIARGTWGYEIIGEKNGFNYNLFYLIINVQYFLSYATLN